MPKPYLDIFGDWYYTKTQGSNKSRSLGIDTVLNFYQKYVLPPEKQTAILEKFSAVFGVDYLFGDKNGVFGSDGKGVDVCRPADVAEILPYLEMRLKTIETEKNIIPGTGSSVYKNRLDRIKKNIERYIVLMKSSNSQKMKVCEQVKGIEEPMTDQDMLQYLAKVLYYGIYPEKAEANIKKCVTDFRSLPMKGTLNTLLAELKARDADKLLSFLKMASVAVASLPGRAADMTSIKIHLTELFDKLKPGLGTSSFSGEGALDKQLETALKGTDKESIMMNAKKANVSVALEEEINKILQSGKTYPPEIVALLKLLKERKINQFIIELNKQYNGYDAQIEKLKKDLNEIIGKLDKDSQDVEEQHKHTVLSRLRRLLGKKPITSAGPVAAVEEMREVPTGKKSDEEENGIGEISNMNIGLGKEFPETFEGVNPIVRFRKVITPEKVGFFSNVIKKMKNEGKPSIEEVNAIDAITKEDDKKLKELEDKNAALVKEIEELKRKAAEIPGVEPGVEKLVRILREADETLSIDDMIERVKKINEGAVSDEVVAELNKLINKYEDALKKQYNVKELLEAIKSLKMLCDAKGEVPSLASTNSELNEEIERLGEGIEENQGNLETMMKDDIKEEYLNTITALVRNDLIHLGMLMNIAGEYGEEKDQIERNIEVIDKLGVPDGLDFDDLFMEVLTQLVYADAPQIDVATVDDEDLKPLLMEVAKLILFMSIGGEGLAFLKNYDAIEFVFNKLKPLMQDETKLNVKEPAIIIEADAASIMLPPAQYRDARINRAEYVDNVVNANKLLELDADKKEFTVIDDMDEDIKTIHESNPQLMNSPLFSRRQLVNLFIALIKKLKGIGNGVEKKEETKDAKEEPQQPNNEELTNENLEIIENLSDVGEVEEEINKGAELNPFAETRIPEIVEETPEVTIANAYTALNETDEISDGLQRQTGTRSLIQEQPEINLMKGEKVAKKKVDVGAPLMQIRQEAAVPIIDENQIESDERLKERRAEMEANERGFTPRKERRLSKEFSQRLTAEVPEPDMTAPPLPRAEQLPNIPAGVGILPEHPVNVKRRKNTSMRLKKLFNTNVPVNNSFEFGKASSKVPVGEDIYGASGEKRGFEPTKPRGKGFKLTKKK
jgi:hypothetical protein